MRNHSQSISDVSSVFENLSLVYSMTIGNSFYEQLGSKNRPGNEMSKYLNLSSRII